VLSRLTLLVCSAGLITILAACGSTSADNLASQEQTSALETSSVGPPTAAVPNASEQGDSSTTSVAEESPSNSLVDPFDAYFGSTSYSDDDIARLRAADALRMAVINECMIEGGFGWYTEDPTVTATAAIAAGGGEDLSAVRERGYRAYIFETWIERAARDVERGKVVFQLSEAELDAWATWYDECADRSDEALAQSRQDHTEGEVPLELKMAVADEHAMAAERVRVNPGFDNIWVDWSECMSRAGYSVQNRDDAEALTNDSYWAVEAAFQQHERGQPLPLELQTSADEFASQEAVIVAADISCADEVNLDRRILDLRHQLATTEVEENGPRWELLRLEICTYLPAGESPCA